MQDEREVRIGQDLRFRLKLGLKFSMRFKISVKYVAACSIRDRDKV